MGETTGISWTDSTFNPWVGCQRVSPGCENCYAEALDKRTGGGIDPVDKVKKLRWGPKAPRVRTSIANWRKPIQWNAAAQKLKTRRRVFCSSLADVFEDREELSDWRRDLFSLISGTPWLDWQLLTKRPENIDRLWPGIYHPKNQGIFEDCPPPSSTAWPNVWLGTTVEDQKRAKERLPHLLEIPAAVHFVSCEPLLERVDLSTWLDDLDVPGPPPIDWVIVGGESGPGARFFDLEWARAIRDQVKKSGRAFHMDGTGGTAVFVKQLGDNAVDSSWRLGEAPAPARAGRHGTDQSLWPEDLRIQQFPEVSP